MKTHVYSWRLSGEIKAELEREARLRQTSVSAVLDLAVSEWLKKSAGSVAEDDRQRQLHDAASKCLGVLAGRNPGRASNARQTVRERLSRRYAR